MKRKLLSILALAALTLLPQGVWATLTPRSANGELFKAFIYGTAKEDNVVGGGTISFESSFPAVVDNFWVLSGKQITCTLAGEEKLAVGDVIKIRAAFTGPSTEKGIRLRAGASGGSDGVILVPGSSYSTGGNTHGEDIELSYTVASESQYVNATAFRIFRSNSDAPNAYVRSITVERSGSDDNMPEVLSGQSKTWTFSSLGSNDEYASTSLVNDNLFYTQGGASSTRFRTVTALNNTVSYYFGGQGGNFQVLQNMTNALMFIVPAGKGVISVNHAIVSGSNQGNIQCKIGRNDAVKGLDDNAYAKANWSNYMFPYDVAVPTPVWIYSSSTTNVSYIKDITVTMGGAKATIGTTGYTTFATVIPLDLSDITATHTATAYYASAASGSTVTLTSTDASVPAGEGLVLKGTVGDEVFIAAAESGTAIDGNKMKGVTWVGTKARLAINNETANKDNFYVLSASAAEFQNIGTYCASNTLNIPAGKAYLDLTGVSLGHALDIIFDDENTTGIQEMKNSRIEELKSYYDLSGRRVVQPTRGLYIVNGKKVVIK